ncbi:MAG: DNA helicase RecG, partial [Gemmatimonadetes bacterium]|nr:DNA helicase RecG [Gemmatimonadota bacterium]
SLFKDQRIALIHGKMKQDETEVIMRDFKAGKIDLLVATTVLEVGVDVANASVMVIEHAERFGLSQLHQMRGRVGRGAAESFCVLVAEPGEVALERLKVLRDTTDGFRIAHEDLRIRGQGDMFGDRQHGHDPLLRFADLLRDEALLAEAQRRARTVVESDPALQQPRHARFRTLLEARHADRLRLFQVG